MTASHTESWQEAMLLDVVQPDAPIGYGIVQPGPYVRDGVPVVAIRDLPRPSPHHLHRIAPSIEAAYSRSRISGGDVLISVKGTTGRVGIVPGGFSGNVSRDVARLRLRNEHDSDFWFQMLQSPQAQRTLQRAAVGSTRRELSISTLKVLRFGFPSRREQERIAAVLTDADDLVNSLEQMIAKKQAIKQGMMQQLLTGKTRLPGFTGRWHSRRLTNVLTYEQPGSYLVRTTQQLDSGRLPVLTAGKTFILGYTNDTYGVYTAHPVIIFDDFTTASKFVDFDFKVKSSAIKILSARPGIDPRFIYERMQLIEFPPGGHKRYWISEYSKLEIEVPDEAEQQAITRLVADVDAEIDALEARLAKARDIKQGMMQELLTGRTRLPVDEGAA